MPFEVVQIPVWQDNYAYLLAAPDGTAALVDGPEAGPILAELEARSLRLTHIFPTHHHYDHIGANEELLEHFEELEVWGSAYDLERERIPGQTRGLVDGETVTWAGAQCVIRAIPAHTLGHIAWCWDHGVAFVGDTLFFGGCGRLFEGTPAQMDHALYEVLGQLPPETLLYCGHEYTQANLAFARSVDPSNQALLDLSVVVDQLRERGQPTVPSRVAQEWAVNPFLRCDTESIRDALGLSNDVPRHEVLGALRERKDNFQG